MKFYISTIVLFVSLGLFIFSGCDSATDSKAVSTTVPTLVSPANNDSLISVTPTFKWSGSADKLEIGTDQSITHLTYSCNITDSTYTLPASNALLPNSWYYWNVGATSGSSVNWSHTIYGFKTRP